ncbi:MAG: porin [Acidobacteria bacterium]|nr:porin [Acidobacteriota bacterium]
MCWDNGLVLDAPGGKIELVFGARFLYDLAWFGQDDALEAGFGDIANDTEMRRASITIDGKLGGRIEFRVQPDFADFNNETRDVYIGFLNIPFFGRVRLGRQKEPIGLNEQTGQLNITFMERSLNSTFTSNRTDGVSASRSFLDQRLEMKYGVYLGETSREGDRSTLALKQVRQVFQALATARPEGEPIWRQRFEDLERDLLELDLTLNRAVTDTRPILGSHPVYQYLARRYQINLRGVQFEPGEYPDERSWRELKQLLEQHRQVDALGRSTPGKNGRYASAAWGQEPGLRPLRQHSEAGRLPGCHAQ